MASTVNTAFEKYMSETVNLDPVIVSAARASRDNLLSNIAEFSHKNGFFTLSAEFNLHFGSFARKTKCRDLDDIDLMIGISANSATYCPSNPWDEIKINANINDIAQKQCLNFDGTLNSTKVLEMFKTTLKGVREYSRSDIHRRGEAVSLNLKSKDWSFDIVPCFYTTPESDERSYYLIPNGKGDWKKTDPLMDKHHVTSTNTAKNGRLLELIRLIKRWNNTSNSGRIPSYLLETLIVLHADSETSLDEFIDFRFRYALKYIADNILHPVPDMKKIQNDINTLTDTNRCMVRSKAIIDYEKACTAWEYESSGDQAAAIKKWCEIFGTEFPQYS